MFKVRHLPTGNIFTVFGRNGVHFLVWNDSDGAWNWEWVPIDQCEPFWEG